MAGGRPLQIAWQEADTAAALRQALQRERNRQVARRRQALWQLREGRGIRATAQGLGVGERARQRWGAWYRAGGLAAVRAPQRAGRGRAAFLTAGQQTALQAQVASGAIHVAQEAVDWVAAAFGVTSRLKGMDRLLARLGGRPKVPRPTKPKSAAAVREAGKNGGSPTR